MIVPRSFLPIILLVLLLGAMSEAGAANNGPSFDCAKAASADETAICGDEELSSLDRSVNDAYVAAKSRVGGTVVGPIGRLLIGERRQCGGDKSCLQNWHNQALRGYATLGTGRSEQVASCTVADPTDTDLAVRATPRGSKLGALQNGRAVQVTERMNDDRGKPWARLKDSQGWVYADYLVCAVNSSAKPIPDVAENVPSDGPANDLNIKLHCTNVSTECYKIGSDCCTRVPRSCPESYGKGDIYLDIKKGNVDVFQSNLFFMGNLIASTTSSEIKLTSRSIAGKGEMRINRITGDLLAEQRILDSHFTSLSTGICEVGWKTKF